MPNSKALVILATPFGMGALVKNTAIGLLYAEVMQRDPLIWWRDWCLYFDAEKRNIDPSYNAFGEFFESPLGGEDRIGSLTLPFFPTPWNESAVRDHSRIPFNWAPRQNEVLPEAFEFPGSDAGTLVFTHYKELNTLLPKIPQRSIYHGLSYSDLLFTIYQKHFRLRKGVTDVLDNLWSRLPINTPVFGIHYRATDKKCESPIPSRSLYLRGARRFLRQNPDGRVFVATDCSKALVYFRKHLPEGSMFCADSIRSDNGQPVHTDNSDCTRKGTDILVDCYALARCDATAMSHASNVATYVIDMLTPSSCRGRHANIRPALGNRITFLVRQRLRQTRRGLEAMAKSYGAARGPRGCGGSS